MEIFQELYVVIYDGEKVNSSLRAAAHFGNYEEISEHSNMVSCGFDARLGVRHILFYINSQL